jgi:ABC-2 type transport system ATP-binding protein
VSTVASASATATPPGTGHARIETRGLSKHYGETVAVDHLDLTINRGEVFGLLGPNGAGKTTTILMMLGLTEPTEGTVKVNGLDPAREALAVKSSVGYLPDDVGFYDDLTGRENLRYTARLNRIASKDAEPLLERLLREVGLTEAADRKVGGYSRGMRQRLGLADALVKAPSILILDEPTVNIDPEGVREILALVTRLRDEFGTTVLLSSHLLHQVEQVCDRIGIFLRGKLVAVGSVAQLTAAMGDQWTTEVAVIERDLDLDPVLRGVRGVTAVAREGAGWVVTSKRDVRGDLLDAIADAGGHLSHLSRRGADIDALYHRYFAGDQAGNQHDDHDG